MHDAINDDVLNARVFALGVLADEDSVNVVIRGFVAGDGFAGANVSKKVESATEGQVERDMAFADGGLPGNQRWERFCMRVSVIRPRVLLEQRSFSLRCL